MSNYIDKPFILEKAVLEISCAYASNRAFGNWDDSDPTNSFTSTTTPSLQICNFFILNQINGKKQKFTREVDVYKAENSQKIILSSETQKQYEYSVRDLITWADVCYVPVEVSSDNNLCDKFVQDEYIFLDESSIDIDRFGNYYGKNGENFTTLTTLAEYGTSLASGIIGSIGREVKFGVSGSSATILNVSEYKALHPEFNSVVGGDGTLSGQANDNPDEKNYNYAFWNKNLTINMNCKAPIKKQNTGTITVWDYFYTIGTNTQDRFVSHGSLSGVENNGRGFNNKNNGRDFKNVFKNSDTNTIINSNKSSNVSFTQGGYQKQVVVKGYKEQKIINPYLLLPSDNIVFGWQLPCSSNFASATNTDFLTGKYNFAHTLGPQLTFAKYPSKITLYGSYVKEDEEHHDTLNQNLTSDTIHEIIG
jgi:hypothetical protein